SVWPRRSTLRSNARAPPITSTAPSASASSSAKESVVSSTFARVLPLERPESSTSEASNRSRPGMVPSTSDWVKTHAGVATVMPRSANTPTPVPDGRPAEPLDDAADREEREPGDDEHPAHEPLRRVQRQVVMHVDPDDERPRECRGEAGAGDRLQQSPRPALGALRVVRRIA